ncbi:MAG: hypothetical protein KC549_12385, partial [Myxococcales bacterium]|nr:hypothetical protein [Myxococcales bacterium]
MNSTLVLVLVIVFAFVVSRGLADRSSRRFLPSGSEFVLVGLAVGPFGLGLARPATVDALQPVVALLIGLLGFTLGLSLRGMLRRVALVPTLIAACVTLGGVAAVVGAFLWALAGLPTGTDVQFVVWPAVALGCIAIVTSGTVGARVERIFAAAGPVMAFLRRGPATFNVVAVVGVGLTLAAVRAHGGGGLTLGTAEWVAASVGGGVASGFLFALFLGQDRDPRRMYLASLGTVILASGVAAGGGLSPLFVNLVAGATVSALSEEATVVRRALGELFAPIDAVILVLAGTMWTPPSGLAWLLLPLYLLVRALGQRVAVGSLLSGRGEVPLSVRAGDGLVVQGGLAVALALDSARLVPEQGSLVLSTVLAAVVLTDLAAAPILRRVLADAGEIDATHPV